MLNKIKQKLAEAGIKPDYILIGPAAFAKVRGDMLTGQHPELAGIDVRQDIGVKQRHVLIGTRPRKIRFNLFKQGGRNGS